MNKEKLELLKKKYRKEDINDLKTDLEDAISQIELLKLTNDKDLDIYIYKRDLNILKENIEQKELIDRSFHCNKCGANHNETCLCGG